MTSLTKISKKAKISTAVLTVLVVFLFLIRIDGVFAESGSSFSNKNPAYQPPESYQTDLFTGRFSKSIPLTVPPGINGMQPDLSLTYFSRGRNSWVGVGWTLEVGFIQKLGEDDYVFQFKGVASKLISIGNNEYRAETEKLFLRFYYTGAYWEVFDKKGNKYRFGYNNDAVASNQTGIYRLHLDRATDLNGNYMSVSYVEDEGQVYIEQIQYTGNDNAGHLPLHTVDFILEDRDDVISDYSGGSEVRMDKRLSQIDIKTNGILARRYVLDYSYSSASGRSLLTSVTEIGSDEQTAFLPQTFTYRPGDFIGFEPSSTWITGFGQDTNRFRFNGDFNGDGRTDIGVTYRCGGNREERLYSNTYIAFSNGYSFISGFSWHGKFAPLGSAFLRVGDFNGDGKSDMVALTGGGGGTSPLYYWYDVALSTGSSFSNSAWLTKVGASEAQTLFADQYAVGDFNGDGKSDILLFHNNGSIRVCLSSGGSFSNPAGWGSSFGANCNKIRVGDFNGDGLDDVVAVYGSSREWRVALSTGASFIDAGVWRSGFSSGITGSGAFAGDVNGDGLTDIGISWSGGYVDVCLSDGSSFARIYELQTEIDASHCYSYIADFNGDRLADIAKCNPNNGSWQVATFTDMNVDLLTEISNGIGGTTKIYYRSSTKYDNTGDDDISDLPFSLQVVINVTISDGIGKDITTKYSYAGGMYDSEKREFRGFNYVKAESPAGYNPETVTEIWFHQDDIFKGKEYEKRTSDGEGNLYNKTVYNWENTLPYPEHYTNVNFPYLANVQNYYYDGSMDYNTMTSVEYQYDDYGNIIRVREEGNMAITGDEKEILTEYTYSVSKWLLECKSHIRTLDYNGQTVAESWFYYDDNQYYTDEPWLGRLTKQEDWLDTGPNPITTFKYDEYGNMVSITDPKGNKKTITYEPIYHTYPETVTNALGHTQRFEYDPKTGNVLRSWDQNGHKTETIYDALGRPIEEYSPNNPNPQQDLWSVKYEYHDKGVFPIYNVVHLRERDNQPDILTFYYFYDGLGRLIQTKSPAEDKPQTSISRQIVSDIVTFNKRGQLEKSFFPFFVEVYSPGDCSQYISDIFSSPGYTYYTYDAMGRVISTMKPDGSLIQTEYNGFVTTLTCQNDTGAQVTRTTKDPFGNIIKVEEFNNGDHYTPYAVTKYYYNALNRLIRIVDAMSNSTLINYDSLGRKLSMDDPNMGIWYYTHDENGNLISQTDAEGQTITYAYDVLNRPLQKILPDGSSVTYAYDTSPNGVGRLSSVTDSASTAYFYYDRLGREIKTEKIIGGTTYIIERSYDALDRIKTLTYPDGEVVTYVYNKQGIAESITGSVTYVSSIDHNAHNQISNIEFGNGTYTRYSYHPQTLRLSRMLTNDGILQDLEYTFDKLGNLTGIVDRANAASQNFQYDELNRLIYADGGYGTIYYSYDKIGNITQKGDLYFNYGEGNAGPHALTSSTNGSTFDYDANGNMIAKNGQIFQYDYENRLVRVEGEKQGETTINIELQPGWNLISLPLMPSDNNISQVLSSLSYGTDYIQVSRYNYATKEYKHYFNNEKFDQFNTMEYGRAYQIYITNPSGCTLTISGTAPTTRYNLTLSKEWNLIPSPINAEEPVEYALSFLSFGIDYDEVARYNTDTESFEIYKNNYSDTLNSLFPNEAYYMYCLKQINCSPPIEASSVTTTFVYDGDGNRIKKITSKGTTTYIDSLYEISGGTSTKHIYLGPNIIASKESTGKVMYYHQDHIGSSNTITDSKGDRIQHLEYRPYGQTYVNEDFGSGTDVKHKFTQKELDDEVGVYFYGARYYDPSLARFIQPDTIIPDISNPQSLNRYSYCYNNPLRYIDPTGYEPWEWDVTPDFYKDTSLSYNDPFENIWSNLDLPSFRDTSYSVFDNLDFGFSSFSYSYPSFDTSWSFSQPDGFGGFGQPADYTYSLGLGNRESRWRWGPENWLWQTMYGNNVLTAEPDEDFQTYYYRFRSANPYQFALSESLGGWGLVSALATHSISGAISGAEVITEHAAANAFRSTAISRNFVIIQGSVKNKLLLNQMKSGFGAASRFSLVTTEAGLVYRIGLKLNAWIGWRLTKRE